MANDKLKKAYDEFVASIKDKSKEELEKLEEEIIKEADALDVKISTLEYTLPEKGKKDAFANIRYFLNKSTYAWQYCFGAKTQYDAWTDDCVKKVKYAVLDNTLRTLGDMQFTGIDEWTKVLQVNDYFAPLREKYIEDTNSIYFVAEKHNAVLQQLDLFKPVDQSAPISPVQEA